MNAVRVDGYTMLGVAGRGGMGVVYRALRADGTLVALKVIAPELVDSDEFAHRFAREARLAAQLEHPHIVPVIEAGMTSDDRPFLAFTYIDGTDLEKHLRAAGKLEPTEAAEIVEQVAGALDTAHAHGFVHRDVKPANVLLDETGTAFLSDFGLTRPVSGTRFTRSGAWLGTVDYAAPEQIQGQHVDARTDIYALAAMSFQLLAGTVAFPRDSDMAKLWAHVNEDRPQLPTSVEHRAVLQPVIDRGMARDPDQRYLSAGDFSAALTVAAAGRAARIEEHMVATGDAAPSKARTVRLPVDEPPLAATPASPTVPLISPRRGRRNALIAATVVAVLLIGSAGAIVALSGQDTPETSPRLPIASTPAPTAASTPVSTATPTATPRPTATPARVASPRRADDLPIVLDSDSYMPSRIGSWNPMKDASVAAAVKAFGSNYTTTTVDVPQECILHWINIGLRVHFVTLFGDDPCGEGRAQSLEIDGILSDRWRTLSGLRPDMPASAIRKLYPRARKHGNAWWLITAYSPIGDGGYFGPITAKVKNGQVTGFDVWVGGAGE
jgi:serine/threonine protein kinase